MASKDLARRPAGRQAEAAVAGREAARAGLMRLDITQHWPRLIFTETGLAALRAMMRDRRLADPVKFAHVRQELGIDPIPEETGAPQL